MWNKANLRNPRTLRDALAELEADAIEAEDAGDHERADALRREAEAIEAKSEEPR
jgi:hypothetical protein